MDKYSTIRKNTKISKTIIYYEEQSYQSLQACLRNVA